jgi:LmbE family N-acetylglucosaminyl deacetylase
MTQETSPRRVMAVFAHPDDAPFIVGGTLALWANQGDIITLVVATSGDKGSNDPVITPNELTVLREAEERAAAKVLGISDVVFLRHKDGELTPSLELRGEITRLIRLKKPNIVVTFDPTVFWTNNVSLNHPDHRAIGEATLDAVYPTARDRLNFPEHITAEGLETHKARTIYIAATNDPTHVVDITSTIEQKITALHEHKSQIPDMDAMGQRMRDRAIDPRTTSDQPRYIEHFRVINLWR